MEINNYLNLREYARRIKYSDFPVALCYSRKKKDFSDESLYTSFKDYDVYSSLEHVNMDEVKSRCNENNCRCYILFFDKLFFRFIGKMALTTQRIHYFLDNEISDSLGLHLIDLDHVEQKNKVLNYLASLNSDKVKLGNVGIFPSKTGQSILFRGPCSIVDKYNEELGNEIDCTAHLFGCINLFIPEINGN